MTVFNEEDRHTVKSLAITFGGFALLTIILIVGAMAITGIGI